MQEYGSKKDLKIEKKGGKIVKGPVKAKQKSELSKVASTFIAEDVSNVKSYVVWDVLIPAIKNTILDIIVDSANMFFGGSRSRKPNSGTNGKIPYRNCYVGSDNSRPAERTRPIMRYSMLDITVDSRGEAEAILRQLRDYLEDYGEVSVGDLYDACGISSEYTDYKYGWANLDSAKAVRVAGGGYFLDLPKVIALTK